MKNFPFPSQSPKHSKSWTWWVPQTRPRKGRKWNLRAGPQSGPEAAGGWKEVSIPLFQVRVGGRGISVKIGTLCLPRTLTTLSWGDKVLLISFPSHPQTRQLQVSHPSTLFHLGNLQALHKQLSIIIWLLEEGQGLGSADGVS